jgi:hypothetical protein
LAFLGRKKKGDFFGVDTKKVFSALMAEQKSPVRPCGGAKKVRVDPKKVQYFLRQNSLKSLRALVLHRKNGRFQFGEVGPIWYTAYVR